MKTFDWIVRHLHGLTRVPGVPHLFNALLLSWSALAHPERLRAIKALTAAVLETGHFQLQQHRFGGTGFAIGNRELAHIHGNGLLDVLIGRRLALELIHAGLANPHHVFGVSAWVSYRLHTMADVAGGLHLIALSASSQGGTKDGN